MSYACFLGYIDSICKILKTCLTPLQEFVGARLFHFLEAVNFQDFDISKIVFGSAFTFLAFFKYLGVSNVEKIVLGNRGLPDFLRNSGVCVCSNAFKNACPEFRIKSDVEHRLKRSHTNALSMHETNGLFSW